jgi:hypothetical protein
MNMDYFSIYLCHLQFPFSMFHSFHHRDLSPPWLNLFPGNLFCVINTNRNPFAWFLFQRVSYWCIEMQPIFVCWFCILQLH